MIVKIENQVRLEIDHKQMNSKAVIVKLPALPCPVLFCQPIHVF